MNLQEVFDQLTYGELSQLSIGGGTVGELSESNYPRVLPHVNLGLTALYKRFPLKEGRVLLDLMTDVLTYTIHSKYAFSNPVPATPGNYLIDTVAAPFTDDVLKIERSLTDAGIELQINDLSDFYSVFTPTATSLRVPVDIVNQAMLLPDWLKTERLELVYRANHPKIVIDSGYFDPTIVELELPDSYLEPLLLFIAARAMSPLGTGQFEGLAGNNYFAKYEQACQQIELHNLRVDQGSQNIRLFQNGWV
jgi:hypothetical protein